MAKSNHPDADADAPKVLRIIDVNLNRLREALRVIEEYFRFLSLDEAVASAVKLLRHSLERIEADFGAASLIASRDTKSDPFASVNKPEELARSTPRQLLAANLKRSQEAARVIEEYAKISRHRRASGTAKALRFSLYDFEKDIMERHTHE
jgi:thiamine-phosphate pyrophosphorylase